MKMTITGLDKTIERMNGLNKQTLPRIDIVYRQVITQTLQYALEHTARDTGVATQSWVVSIGSGGVNGSYGIAHAMNKHKSNPEVPILDSVYHRTGLKYAREKGTKDTFAHINRRAPDKRLSVKDDGGLVEETLQNNTDRIRRVQYNSQVNLLNVAPRAHIKWLEGDKKHLRDVNQDAKSSLEIIAHAKSVIVPRVVAAYRATTLKDI